MKLKLIDINTELEVTGKNVFVEYPEPFHSRWGANVWEPVITSKNVEGKIQYVRWTRYYYDKRDNARKADVTHEIGQYGRVA